jgi:MFS transporter, PAT family, beta-lactamase induction signal transducer AmpG
MAGPGSVAQLPGDTGLGDAKTPASAAAAPSYKHPLLWVPSSYFTMGLVWVTVTTVATIMFKNMGMANEDAAFWSSLLGLPYTIKPFWAPLLELYRTKKFFVVLMQLVVAAVLAAVAFALKLPGAAWVFPVILLMGVAGLAGATQDIGTDGVYVTTLNRKEQAKYQGIQSMCWNMGPILANGALVALSGTFHESTGSWGTSWMIVLLITAGIVFLAAPYHSKLLPPGAKSEEAPKSAGDVAKTFGRAFATFFQKPGIILMISFAFFYRFGYGLLDKMGPVFLIDERANGGLGLTNQMLGKINGGFGTGAFIAGSLLGGLFVAKIGLKRSSLLLLCFCLNIPNLTFLYLSQTMPSDPNLVIAMVIIEKFGWGFGAVGHMLYMMQQIAPGPYKTAHYTFATALMGLCMTLTGMVSGHIQNAVGYQTFFIIVLLAAIPSLLATLLAPFPHGDFSEPDKAKA